MNYDGALVWEVLWEFPDRYHSQDQLRIGRLLKFQQRVKVIEVWFRKLNYFSLDS